MASWHRIFLLSFFGITLIHTSGLSQEGKVYFQRINLEDGLPQGHIFEILEDELGFIWFCTGNGLARYDGYDFFVYQSHPEDTTTLSSSWVTEAMIDRSGNFWVGTEGGLNLFNRKTGTFKRFSHKPNDSTSISDNRIRDIYKDSNGNLWVSTITSIELFDQEKETFRKIATVKGGRHAPDIIETRDHNILVSGVNNLTLIDSKTLKSTPIFPFPDGRPITDDTQVGQFWMSPDSILFLAGMSGLWEQIPGTYKFKKIDLGPNHTGIRCFKYEPRDSTLWIGTFASGIIKYDYKKKKALQTFSSSITDPEGISNNNIYSFLRDQQGNLWIGTFNGINRINPEAEKFSLYQNKAGEDNMANYTLRIYQDPEGRIWTMTMRGVFLSQQAGLPAQNIWEPYLTENKWVHVGGFAYTPDRKGWFDVADQGLFYLNPESTKMVKVESSEYLGSTIRSHLIGDPIEPNIFWMSSKNGLLAYNTSNRDTFWIRPMEHSLQLRSNIIRRVAFAPDGKLWAITTNGLLSYDRNTRKIELFNFGAGFEYCESTDPFRSITVNKHGIFSSSSKAVTWFQPDKKTCQVIGTKDGLFEQDISSIQASQGGLVWISGFSYLMSFDPETGIIQNFPILHSAKELNSFSSWETADNQILFGGTNGFLRFKSNGVSIDTIAPKLVLLDFKVLNESYTTDTVPEYLNEIRISYEDKVFSFEYAGLHYDRANGTRYKYYLEGFDSDWQLVGPKRTATYTNLSPGHYTFHLNAKNVDGIWSPNPLSIDLIISPAYWQTTWFYFLIASILLSIAYAIIQSRHRARKLLQEKLLAEQSAKYKSLFLANMSHEIRTPMNAILGMSNLLYNTPLNEKQKEYAGIIRRSSENLLVIINDILDHSKIESGKYSFVQKTFELKPMLRQLQQIFSALAYEKNLILNSNIHEETPVYLIGDQVRLNQILINLVANAIKFTEAGFVNIRVKPIEFKGSEEAILQFEIQDTGIGIREDQSEQIFSSFEQIEGEEFTTGTGLGLAISRNLVEQQGGKIWVESMLGKGATFFFQLPFKIGTSVPTKPKEQAIDPSKWGVLSILIVEDTPFNQVLSVELLKNKIPNVQVVIAENGLIAIEKLKNLYFDLVLMDIKMPVMDGYEATKIIRKSKNRTLRSIPIIALTANVTSAHLEKCRIAGMDAIITKPINTSELFTAIQKSIKK